MTDLKNIAYAFTVKCGGWQPSNDLCIVTKDGVVMFSSHFYGTINDLDTFKVEATYKLSAELSNYDLESYKDFEYLVMDSPTYTMYKFEGGVTTELFSSTHEDCCVDMQRILRLCLSGGNVKC